MGIGNAKRIRAIVDSHLPRDFIPMISYNDRVGYPAVENQNPGISRVYSLGSAIALAISFLIFNDAFF